MRRKKIRLKKLPQYTHTLRHTYTEILFLLTFAQTISSNWKMVIWFVFSIQVIFEDNLLIPGNVGKELNQLISMMNNEEGEQEKIWNMFSFCFFHSLIILFIYVRLFLTYLVVLHSFKRLSLTTHFIPWRNYWDIVFHIYSYIWILHKLIFLHLREESSYFGASAQAISTLM